MAWSSDDPYLPCRCGSGQKYKFCCRKNDLERRRNILAELPTAPGPDGRPVVVLDLEESQRLFDQGTVYLAQGQGRNAKSCFQKMIRLVPTAPQPYNNLALACYLEGDLDAAIGWSEKVDGVVDPGNVFALGNLVQFYLLKGLGDKARAIGNRMGRLAGRDEFAETRRCEALARLGLHAEVLEAAVRALPAASECAGDLAYYAGVAAANLARYEEAADYLARARSSIPFDEPAKRYLAHLRKRTSPSTLGGDWPYFSMQHWLPPGLFERIKADGGPNRYPGLVEALVCAINETGGRDPDPLTVLKTIGSPEARAVLERIASGTFGTDRVRIHAHRMLVELGERRGDLPATLWLQGEWKTLVVTVHEITEEAPSTLPAELQDRMHEAIEASRRKDWLRAEQIGRELRSKAPDHPQVCFNLAVALNAQDKLPEEVEALLLHAMRVDPSYPAAPSTLAMIRIRQDRLPEAKELLDRVKLPSKLHPTVYAIFLMAKAQVAVADGDFAAAAGTWEWLERISPESPMVREARDTWGGRLLRLMAPLRRRRARCREQQRRRLLSADPPLSECLEPLTREVLQETARAMNLPLPARLRKAELIAGIIRRLGDRRTVGVFRDSVGEPARTALDRVVAAGGVMPFAEFTRQWGAEEDGPPGWEWKEPGNVLGRLKFLGLLAEGTVGGRESVVVPREVREALRPQTA